MDLSRQSALHVSVFGTDYAVTWGPAVTEVQADGLRGAWSRCVTADQSSAGVPAEAGTEARPYTSCLTRTTPSATETHLHLTATTFEELAELITSHLTFGAIEAQAGHLVMLHASGVADLGTGRVVALVAKSGTGKTTSCRLLGREFGYITDETVAIRGDGTVLPYPKPLSVKNGKPNKDQIGPNELGLLDAPDRPHIHGLALLDRQDGWRGGPQVEELGLVDAILALVPETSSQGRIEKPLQSLCELVDSVGGVRRITYSEARDLPAIVARMLQREHEPRPPEWSPRASAVDDETPIPPGHYRRGTVEDAVEVAGDLLVLANDQIMRISGIGPTIWDAAASALTHKDLVEAVIQEHGAPENFEMWVDEAVAHLLDHGILRHSRP